MCKTPIRTALRYGDIIKRILNDFEKVKAKLIVPDYKLELERKRLHAKIMQEEMPKDFSKDAGKILDTVCHTRRLTSDQLNMYENQINFMSFLGKILSRINKFCACEATIPMDKIEALSSLIPAVIPKEEVFDLRSRIMQLRTRFSEQEKEEINEELFRVSLLTSYRILAHQIEKKNIHLRHQDEYTLDHIGDVLKTGKRIGEYGTHAVMIRL